LLAGPPIRLVIAVALRLATPSIATALITRKNRTPSTQSKPGQNRVVIALDKGVLYALDPIGSVGVRFA